MEINHVLIVEDDKEIREGVQIYLQSQGYKVFQAADGIEGLEVLEREEIHLAIIDIMMPRMDGIRMTMKLREKYDFPAILFHKSLRMKRLFRDSLPKEAESCTRLELISPDCHPL